MNSDNDRTRLKIVESHVDPNNIKVISIQRRKKVSLKPECIYSLVNEFGLSTVFSTLLMAVQESMNEEESIEVKDAMEDFFVLGSSLNERYVLKVTGQSP